MLAAAGCWLRPPWGSQPGKRRPKRLDGTLVVAEVCLRAHPPEADMVRIADLYDLTVTLSRSRGPGSCPKLLWHALPVAFRSSNPGQPPFQRLVLDQGYYPAGIYTVKMTKHSRMISRRSGPRSSVRLHQALEPRFLYWADRLLFGGMSFPTGAGCQSTQSAGSIPASVAEASIATIAILYRRLVSFNETQIDQDPGVIRGVYRAPRRWIATGQ